MSNLLQESLSIHAGLLRESASETITYRRGSVSEQVVAIRAQVTVPDGGGEIIANADVTDWLIEPKDLVLAGSPTEPQRSDQILISDGEVFDLLPGNPFDFSDSHKTYFRVHAVRRRSSV